MTDTSTAEVARILGCFEFYSSNDRGRTFFEGAPFGTADLIYALAAERDAIAAERDAATKHAKTLNSLLGEVEAERDALRAKLSAVARAVSPGFVRARPADHVKLELDDKVPL